MSALDGIEPRQVRRIVASPQQSMRKETRHAPEVRFDISIQPRPRPRRCSGAETCFVVVRRSAPAPPRCGGRPQAPAAQAQTTGTTWCWAANAPVATTLTVGGDTGGVEPALALENADGPSLRMNALSHTWAGQLAVGEMAGTELGPIVGVETAFGATTTYLVTGVDLANMATPFASTPTRVLDLRTEAGRASIIRRSSPDAMAADGKLRAGSGSTSPSPSPGLTSRSKPCSPT